MCHLGNCPKVTYLRPRFCLRILLITFLPYTTPPFSLMYILSVDPPAVLRSSFTSTAPSFSTPVPSFVIETRPIAASLFVDGSRPISPTDTWVFDCHLEWDVEPVPCIGVGDTIAVYRQACIPSSSAGPLLGHPAFTGTLVGIAGWNSDTIEFRVDIPSYTHAHSTTIQLPWAICRLSWLQRLWGWMLPFPRCSLIHMRPHSPIVNLDDFEDLVWSAVDV
jgi:hypothetical protein